MLKSSSLLIGVLTALLLISVTCVINAGGFQSSFYVAGKPFGVGRELCVNAFGHRGDPRIELFLGDIRLPLVRLNEPCDCSLCRAGLTR